jgi:hypothetical protein
MKDCKEEVEGLRQREESVRKYAGLIAQGDKVLQRGKIQQKEL